MSIRRRQRRGYFAYERFAAVFTIATIGMALLACKDEKSDSNASGGCTPGNTRTCICDDGSNGEQVCAQNGANWRACDCDDSNPGSNGGVSTARFCNSLVYDDGSNILAELTIGEGDDAVTIAADSNACSADVGDACTEVENGSEVYALLTLDGQAYMDGYFTIDADESYIFSLELDGENEASVYATVIESADCSHAQCAYWYYTEGSCAADDPCGLVEDGNCDNICELMVSEALDDSSDCAESFDGIAMVRLCNVLDVSAELIVGTGDDEISLTANPGTCSDNIGDACQEVSAGVAVPTALYIDGELIGDEPFPFENDIAYLFSTEPIDDSGDPTVYFITLDADACSDVQCTEYWYYTNEACVASDPCDWIENDICDEPCMLITDGEFDDSVDCADTDAE